MKYTWQQTTDLQLSSWTLYDLQILHRLAGWSLRLDLHCTHTQSSSQTSDI